MSSSSHRAERSDAVGVIGGFLAAQIVVVVAQAVLLRLFIPAGTLDPVSGVVRYEYAVKWIAHPLAAVVAGVVVGSAASSRRPVTLLLIALLPLWTSWLRPSLMSPLVVAQCVVYLVVAWFSLRLVRAWRAEPRARGSDPSSN